MVEIVTRILPQLERLTATDASMKSELFLLLGEEAKATAVWARLSSWMRGAGAKGLKELQEIKTLASSMEQMVGFQFFPQLSNQKRFPF